MAIAFDNSTQGPQASSPGTQTYSHTCTGSNLILYVHVYTNPDNSNKVSGVTYNGVSMTLVNISGGLLGAGTAYLYRLVGPATGANNVVVTYSGATFGVSVATSYTGAKQSGGVFVSNTNTGASTDTVTLTPNSANNWIVMAVASSNAAPTAGGAAFLRQVGSNVAITAFDTNGAVTGSTSMTANASPGNMGAVAESFEPVVSASANGNFLAFM